MKILMFAPYCYPVPGGQESHVHELARVLEKNGVEVDIISRYKFSKSRISTLFFYIRSFFRVFGKNFDIVHGHDIHAGFVLMVYKLFSRRKSILTVHSSIFLETYKKYPWLYRKMFKNQALLFTTSMEIKKACEEVTERPVHFISNGVDTERFRLEKNNFLRKKFSIPEKCRIIITTRRLDRKNNVITLAKAFDIITKKRSDMYLVIVGDGEQRGEIEKLKNDRIIITGFVDNKEIPKYLNSADIFAIPSLYEANSISCLEAMACGLPVLGTNIGGLPELIRDNGVLCEPTISGVSLGLEKILKTDLARLGKRSSEIAKNYSWSALVKTYLNLYRKVFRDNYGD